MLITMGTNHNLEVGDVIQFTTTGELPTGLALDTNYYVLLPSSCQYLCMCISFCVSLSSGGDGIVYSDTGTGTPSWHGGVTTARIYDDILDDLDDTLDGMENKRRVIIEINYE